MFESLECLFREIAAQPDFKSGRVEVCSTIVVELVKQSPNGRKDLRIEGHRRAAFEIRAERCAGEPAGPGTEAHHSN